MVKLEKGFDLFVRGGAMNKHKESITSEDLGKSFFDVAKTVVSSGDEDLFIQEYGEKKKCAIDFVRKAGIKVDDQYVAMIELFIHYDKSFRVRFEKEFFDNDKRQEGACLESEQAKTVVIVLESPHTSEYKDKKSVGPACGSTGLNIRRFFLKHFINYCLEIDDGSYGLFSRTTSEIENGKYKLVLLNSVQYQCSLGVSLKNNKKKNMVFAKCLENDTFSDDLFNRLRLFKPDIVINACTGGEDGKLEGNKLLVENIIEKACPKAIKLMSYHPSSTFFAQGFWKQTI